MHSTALSKPQNNSIVSLPKKDRFAGKDPLAIAEILQHENPSLKYLPLLPQLKKPLGGSAGWKDCTADLASLYDGVEYEGNGLGVVLGGKPYFALDVDTKKEHKGATNLCRWLGFALPEGATEEQAISVLIAKLDTRIVRTPSGGLHIYFKHEFSFRAAFPALPKGCEWRGIKGFLVAPGTHTEASADRTGNTFTGTYEIVKDRPIALAPKIILAALVDVDAPVNKIAGAAIGKPVPLNEFMDVIGYVNPDHPRDKWIVQAGSFHNTNLVDTEGEPLEEEKLDLWLRFCRGEFWKGLKDSWIGGLPSHYTGDDEAEIGYDSIGPKDGGAGYGALVYEARKNGYGLHSTFDDAYPDDLEGEAIATGLINANDYMAENIEYRHIVYDENGDGVIPDHGVVGVVAPYSTGKSTLDDELGYSLATGTAWLGKFPVERRVVISCPLEDEPGAHDRLRAWCMAHYGKAEMPDPTWHYTWKHPLTIDDPKAMKKFAAKVNMVRTRRPVMFIVDTWQALISGIGDGQNDDGAMMGIVNKNLKYLIKECGDNGNTALAIIAAHPPKVGHYADEHLLTWAGAGGTSNDATGIIFIINVQGGDKRLWIEKCRGGKARYDLCRFRLQTSETGRKDHRGRNKLGMLALLSGTPQGLGKPNTDRHIARRRLMIAALVETHLKSKTGQCLYMLEDLVAAWKTTHPEDATKQDKSLRNEITGVLFKGLTSFRYDKTGHVVEYKAAAGRGHMAYFEVKEPADLNQ